MSFLRFLLRRLALAAFSMVGAAVLVSVFLHLVPGDPVDSLLGEQAAVVDRDTLRACIGYDDPSRKAAWASSSLPGRSFLWVAATAGELAAFARDLWTLELKTSVPPCREEVFPKVRRALPRTALLAVSALLVALLVGVPLGITGAVRKGRWVDSAAMGFALLGASVPRFWLGPILVLIFSLGLRWLPVSGFGTAAHLVLPTLTLGLAMAALLARMTRASMLEVVQQEFVTAARGRGLSETAVIWKHTLRNALLPVVTLVGLELGALLGGAVITERVFAWPGMGLLLLNSIEKRDYNAVRACVLVFTFLYLAVNLLADVVSAAVDPRIRSGSQ